MGLSAGTYLVPLGAGTFQEKKILDALARVEAGDAAGTAARVEEEARRMKSEPARLVAVSADAWSHPYSREQAAYPVPGLRAHKFWPAVGRVDNTHGDRNLVCSCPPIGDYAAPPSEESAG